MAQKLPSVMLKRVSSNWHIAKLVAWITGGIVVIAAAGYMVVPHVLITDSTGALEVLRNCQRHLSI